MNADVGGLGVLVVLVGTAAAAGIGLSVWSGRTVRRRSARARESYTKMMDQIDAVYQAAMTSADDLRRQLGPEISINMRDARGDTALHRAHYDGQETAVSNLIGCGADGSLPNHEGVTPHEMAGVRAAETLLREGLACLSPVGVWLDTQRGRRVCSKLRSFELRVYNCAVDLLVAKVLPPWHVVTLAIKIGFPGSEQKLIDLLYQYGFDLNHATIYLHSESPYLKSGAARWVARMRNPATPWWAEPLRRGAPYGSQSPAIWGQF